MEILKVAFGGRPVAFVGICRRRTRNGPIVSVMRRFTSDGDCLFMDVS